MSMDNLWKFRLNVVEEDIERERERILVLLGGCSKYKERCKLLITDNDRWYYYKFSSVTISLFQNDNFTNFFHMYFFSITKKFLVYL